MSNWNRVFKPIVVLVVCCVIGMIYSGGFFSGENFVDAVANLRRRLVGSDFTYRNHVQNVKVDVSFPAEHVLENCFRVRQCADDNRDARLLRNFERAVAERLEKA